MVEKSFQIGLAVLTHGNTGVCRTPSNPASHVPVYRAYYVARVKQINAGKTLKQINTEITQSQGNVAAIMSSRCVW